MFAVVKYFQSVNYGSGHSYDEDRYYIFKTNGESSLDTIKQNIKAFLEIYVIEHNALIYNSEENLKLENEIKNLQKMQDAHLLLGNQKEAADIEVSLLEKNQELKNNRNTNSIKKLKLDKDNCTIKGYSDINTFELVNAERHGAVSVKEFTVISLEDMAKELVGCVVKT